jgi:hypothetical protein
MDCFACARNDGEIPGGLSFVAHPRRGTDSNKIYRPQQFFIIFVDAIFTTLFEWLFTNVFDVTSAKAANACLYRAGNGD